MTIRSKFSSPAAASVPVSAEEVRGEVERICAYSGFASSPTLQRFLRFTVERVLQGGGKDLKEHTIGREVLGRGIGFDPTQSSIVRTHAFNLRSRLNAFYAEHGTTNSFRILYEPGGYAPVFAAAGASAEVVEETPPMIGLVKLKLSMVEVPAAGEPLISQLQELRSELIREINGQEQFRLIAAGSLSAADFELEAWPFSGDGHGKLQVHLIDHRKGGFYAWTGNFQWHLAEFDGSALAGQISVELAERTAAARRGPESLVQ